MHSAIWIARGMLAPSGEGWFAAQLDGDCRLVHRGKSLALWVPLLWCGPLWWCLNIVPPCFSTISTSQGCHFLLFQGCSARELNSDSPAGSHTRHGTSGKTPRCASGYQTNICISSMIFFSIWKTIQSIFHNPGDAHSSPLAPGRQPARQLWTTATRLAGVGDQQQSLQRESFVSSLIYGSCVKRIFSTCRQVREHPSHHRGPGWEQGGQVSIILITQSLWSQTTYL